MSEILGLGVTHYPGLYAQDEDMARLLRRTLSGRNMPERAKDPLNWPAGMRAEWGEDDGARAAHLHRERCFNAFGAVREKLDRFRPDFVLIFGDDQYENFVEDIVPPFCLYILDEIESRPFEKENNAAPEPPNIWKEGSGTVFRHSGHADGARFIANRLCDEGTHLPYAYRLRHHKGLAHAFINTLMYLDADRRGFDYPVVPLHVNCYGGSLVRSRGGRLPLSEIGREPDPPAPSAAACFDLGRAIGRVLAQSPWRVALIASSSWSHAFLTRKNDWIYPDHVSDRARLEELREGRFACWRDLAREQLEEAGQHELLNWVALAGAMAELGHKAQIIDYIETYVLNSNKCFASWI
jgi:hypothetical protein